MDADLAALPHDPQVSPSWILLGDGAGNLVQAWAARTVDGTLGILVWNGTLHHSPLLDAVGGRPLLIAKWLGTNAAALAAERRLRTVWLTPV